MEREKEIDVDSIYKQLEKTNGKVNELNKLNKRISV